MTEKIRHDFRRDTVVWTLRVENDDSDYPLGVFESINDAFEYIKEQIFSDLRNEEIDESELVKFKGIKKRYKESSDYLVYSTKNDRYYLTMSFLMKTKNAKYQGEEFKELNGLFPDFENDEYYQYLIDIEEDYEIMLSDSKKMHRDLIFEENEDEFKQQNLEKECDPIAKGDCDGEISFETIDKYIENKMIHILEMDRKDTWEPQVSMFDNIEQVLSYLKKKRFYRDEYNETIDVTKKYFKTYSDASETQLIFLNVSEIDIDKIKILLNEIRDELNIEWECDSQ